MATIKRIGLASQTTSTSELGESLASAYEERMAVRVARAEMLPTEPAPVVDRQGNSPELASLAGHYLNADTLSEEDVENVRSLAASVLSQRMTD